MGSLARRIVLTLLLAALTLSTGCTGALTALMVDAKNAATPPSVAPMDASHQRMLGIDDAFRVEVGPPDANLSVWLLEPDDRTSPRGTVLVLHGYADRQFWMLGHARRLRDAGYRTAVVALRGHGQSTGKHLTFGVVERHDIRQVLDALEARGQLTEHVGVLGMSYGASVAIEAAGVDERVDAVVAMAGFSDMRSEMRHFTRLALPVAGWFMRDADVDALVDAAGERGGFDPDDASAVDAIARTRARVLIVHGEWDVIVPVGHARRLHAAAPQRSELLLLPMTGHAGVWMDADGRIARRTLAWFDQSFTSGG